MDLIISIYELSEAKFLRPVCENFIVKGWNKQNSEVRRKEDYLSCRVMLNLTIKERKNTRVQFGDISKNDIANKRLFLVCNVVTEGNYNNKSSTNMGLNHDSEKKILNFRKPVGVAALDITDQFTFKQGKATQLVSQRIKKYIFLTLRCMKFSILMFEALLKKITSESSSILIE